MLDNRRLEKEGELLAARGGRLRFGDAASGARLLEDEARLRA
jgi:hypothetical protein